MATIRQIGKGSGRRFQAMVRKTIAGEKHHISRVFWKAKEADDWARRCEDAIASATPLRPFKREEWAETTIEKIEIDDTKPHAGWSVSQAFDLYKENVTDKRGGAVEDGYRIGFWKSKLGTKSLKTLSVQDVQTVIVDRLTQRAGDTVRREVNIIRGLIKYALDEWKIEGLADFSKLKLPPPSPNRERRLEDGHGDMEGEEQRLLKALATWKRSPDVHVDMFHFSIETGLRLSELHAVTVGHIKRPGGVVRIELEKSKNGDPRKVVLSARAREIVDRRILGKAATAKLFPVSDSARKRAWAYARKEAGVEGLRWHDLRHEAISRMASAGLHLKELMSQSGHRDTESVARYMNAKAREISDKLG